MLLVQSIKAFFAARTFSGLSRAHVLLEREKLLRGTLLHAYDHSKFYRKRWETGGITRAMLLTININDLPVVTKRELMEDWDDVITERGITKEEVQKFIAENPDGEKKFRGRYVLLNTSGSSGVIGMFLFSPEFWSKVMGVVAARLLPFAPFEFLFRKVRIAFVGETSGHHAGVSMVRSVPSFLQTVSIDVASPKEEMERVLSTFQPNALVGYASGLSVVADLVREGGLALLPRVIISSGEPLSQVREQSIENAFGIRPIDLYGATECLAMGASLKDGGVLEIFDDILLVETVDDSGNLVEEGTTGRVAITVFGNDIFPLVRYMLDDELILMSEEAGHSLTRAKAVSGRKLERIPLALGDGRTAEFHPMDFVGLFVPGMKQYQIIQVAPLQFIFRYVASGERASVEVGIREITEKLLTSKGITNTDVRFEIELVEDIPCNPKTGKTPLIIPLKK